MKTTQRTPTRSQVWWFIAIVAVSSALAGLFAQLLAKDFRKWSPWLFGVCITAMLIGIAGALIRRSRAGSLSKEA